jgi:DNA-binding transcriptional LysR family regulator
VISDYPSGLPETSGILTTPLMRDELLVALPRDHPLAGSDPVDLWRLRHEPWIQNAPAGRPTVLDEACARAGFTPKSIRVAEWTGKFGYVAAGLGVTIVPALAAQALPADLVLCRISGQEPARTVHLAFPPTPLPAARTLGRLLSEGADTMTASRDFTPF